MVRNNKYVFFIGEKYGHRTIVDNKIIVDKRNRLILCRCKCGKESLVRTFNLKNNKNSKCRNCAHAFIKTHGMKNTTEYNIWDSMKQRCLNVNAKDYIRYGARGIKICDKWLSFEGFYADMGPRPFGMQLDRIDNDGNYEKENCRWATPLQNSNNKRNNYSLRTNEIFDGARYGNRIIVSSNIIYKNHLKKPCAYILCRCDCGKESLVGPQKLITGEAPRCKSCTMRIRMAKKN